MKKIRVYELAKELNIPAKEAVSELNELGFKITSHMAALDDESYQLAKEELSKKFNSVEEKSEKNLLKKQKIKRMQTMRRKQILKRKKSQNKNPILPNEINKDINSRNKKTRMLLPTRLQKKNKIRNKKKSQM